MNRVNIWLLILGMAVVTYVPRALPAVLIEKMHFSPKVEKFLQLIPYTAMAALIFPGVLSADAARPEISIPLYELVISECKARGFEVGTGEFGADMKVSLVNDGPFTIILDSDTL
jgi:branched-subunit amino acid transport protein